MLKQQLFKSFNRKSNVLFSVTTLLDSVAKDGKVYNKLQLDLVQLDQNSKAEKQASFFLSIPSAKVLFHDLWTETLHEYKDAGISSVQRYLAVSKNDNGSISFKVDNKTNGDYCSLFIGISPIEARKLARVILDFLQQWELAKIISGVLQQTDNSDIDRINDELQIEAEQITQESDVNVSF